MSIEGQGHFFTIYFPGFVCFKVKTVDFSETIAASDLKVGRNRLLNEFMKVSEY